jgi:hypothetical protein
MKEMVKVFIPKLGVLSLVLVLCLASIGVAFSGWTEKITVNGTLDTGDVSVKFGACKSNDPKIAGSWDPTEAGVWYFGTNDNSDDPNDWTWVGNRIDGTDLDPTDGLPPIPATDKASLTCDIDPAYTGFTDGKYLEITLDPPYNGDLTEGGYPGYCGHAAYTVVNDGSVPVKIEKVVLAGVSKGTYYPIDPIYELSLDTMNYIWFEEVYGDHDGDPSTPDIDYVIPHVDTSLQKDGDIVLTEFTLMLTHIDKGQQIHSGEWIPGDLCYCVREGSSPGAVYDFVIEVAAKQWNEVP